MVSTIASLEKLNAGSVVTGSTTPNKMDTKGAIIPKVKREKKAYNILQINDLTIYER
jgi:hypothetical protein